MRYTFFYVRIPFVSGSVGMADELDSGSSVGYYVWVQVPSPACKRKDLGRRLGLFFCSRACLVPKVQGLRSAPVGAKQTSTGRLAPHLPHVKRSINFLYNWYSFLICWFNHFSYLLLKPYFWFFNLRFWWSVLLMFYFSVFFLFCSFLTVIITLYFYLSIHFWKIFLNYLTFCTLYCRQVISLLLFGYFLFYRYYFCKVSRLINIASII